MNIYLLRHGETEQNEKKTYYGSLDVSLNEKGKNQALSAKNMLHKIDFSKVFISDRIRTLEMAEIIFEDKEIEFIKDSRINEMSFGIFEGKTYEEIGKLYPEEQELWQNNWKEYCPKGGESYAVFYKRIKSFMEDLKKLDEENILIVTHGGVIRTIYCYVLDENLDFYWKFASSNGDISLIKYKHGSIFIDSIIHV
ncbi:MAG: alpha-ribazole phosphatase [Bacillota bacterium]|nr:alpha-ribazole phosphatase [Bacillota bacterium]